MNEKNKSNCINDEINSLLFINKEFMIVNFWNILFNTIFSHLFIEKPVTRIVQLCYVRQLYTIGNGR